MIIKKEEWSSLYLVQKSIRGKNIKKKTFVIDNCTNIHFKNDLIKAEKNLKKNEKKINVLSTLNLNFSHEIFKKLNKYIILSKTNNLKGINKAEVYLASAAVNIDKNIIDKAKKLKLILSPSTGTDHLDLGYLQKKKLKLFILQKKENY